MASDRINFTKRAIEELPPASSGRRDYYYDTKTRGLCLAVTPTGTKTFQVYRWVQGCPERITLGRFPDLSIEAARGKAYAVNAQIAQGENPADRRRKIQAESTVGDLFAIYLEQHAKPHKKTWRQDLGQFQRYGEPISGIKLSALSRSRIERLHQEIGREHGPYAANRFLALLHKMFGKAADWGWQGPNPAARIVRFRERSRDRFLLPSEIGPFLAALEAESDEAVRDYFWLCLLTGARRSDLLRMRWEEVNLAEGVWRIPETKNGTSHMVPLVPRAIEILSRRLSQRNPIWVFPGRGKAGHLADPSRAWRRIKDRAGLPDLRIHDLRRTLGSWQAALGTALPIIGRTLGHKSVAATAIYARLDLDPVASSLHRATTAMLEAADLETVNEADDQPAGPIHTTRLPSPEGPNVGNIGEGVLPPSGTGGTLEHR